MHDDICSFTSYNDVYKIQAFMDKCGVSQKKKILFKKEKKRLLFKKGT